MTRELIHTAPEVRLHRAWDVGAVVVGVVGGLFLTIDARGATQIGVGLIAGAVTLLLRTFSMRKTMLVLDGTSLEFHGWVRNCVLSTAAQPGRVVRVTLTGVAQTEGQIWFGPTCSRMLMTKAWGEPRLAELARRLGLDVIDEPEPISVPDLAKRYPGIVPWYGAHPTATGLIVLAVLMAVGLAITLP